MEEKIKQKNSKSTKISERVIDLEHHKHIRALQDKQINDLRQFDFDENRIQLKNIHLAKVAELSEKHIALNMMNIDR